jgi:hypothetical protein
MIHLRVLAAVLVRPFLWPTAVGALFAYSPNRWWARAPFLPIPDKSVIEWRMTTAYGRANMALAPEDVVSYLRWRREA